MPPVASDCLMLLRMYVIMLLTSENRIKSFKLTFASSLPRKPASNQITSIIGACCTEKKITFKLWTLFL